MSEDRHSDIFSASEALSYLHLPAGDKRTLATLRAHYGLPAHKIGKHLYYHRVDLDSLVNRIFGLSGCWTPEQGRVKPLAFTGRTR